MREIKADIITIGDEILYGQTVDTNSAFIGKALNKVGIGVNRIVSISDHKETILSTLDKANADIVLITGGLGPTLDDITKSTLCTFFDDTLTLNETAWKWLNSFYDSRNRTISDVNRLQAHLPTTCTCLPNKIGTASGMWFEKEGTIYVSMPGVPREMQLLITDEVIPRLQEKLTLPVIQHQFINTVGIPESDLAEMLDEWVQQLPNTVSLAYLPSMGQVKLRMTMKGDDKKEMEKVLSAQTSKVLSIIEKYVYSTDETTLVESVAKLLIDMNLSISTGESCTGGNIAKYLTSVAGSSSYFMGSVVSYSNDAKMNLLNVSADTIAQFGAVSEETVTEMVKGVARTFNTDLAIATTGIAGPDGGTTEKPVGTVWVGIMYKGEVHTKLLHIGDLGRSKNIENTTIAALNLIRKTLYKN